MPPLTIRPATESDCEIIYDFICKMARYEKLSAEVDTSPEALRHALFKEHQAEVIIGEVEGNPVGFALYFYNFSTFRGQRGLYLEDLYVDQEQRGRGYGKALLLHLTAIAARHKCRRMEWVALDWNRPAIEFYRSLGAVDKGEWLLFRLNEEQIQELSKQAL